MTLARDMMPPPLLKHILVVVSFYWNVEKLVYLGNFLTMIQAYETGVDIVIITNNDQALKRVLETRLGSSGEPRATGETNTPRRPGG
jgi:hypothetical protein